MRFDITIPGVSTSDAQPELPIDYSGFVLNGAEVKAFSSGSVEAVIQYIKYDDFAIRLLTGNFIKKFEIKNWFLSRGFYGSFILKNGIRKSVRQMGKVHLRKDHYTFSYVGNADFTGIVDQDNSFQMLDIFYSPGLLEQLAPFFKGLQQLLKTRENILVGNKVYWTPIHIREIYSQILLSDYDMPTQQLYFELKVREILFHLLQNSIGLPYSDQSFTPYEVSRIHEAKTILETYIDKKPPTIRELSRMVAINEFKLKLGFRKYFNSGIFSWIHDQKMYQAKRLLTDTNKPIKEIAAMSGYPRTTNFITAFRRHFGITPGSLRRS